MHSDNAADPPAVPGPAALPSAVLASCSVIRSHEVMPLPPAFTAAVAAAGAAAEEVGAGVAAEEVAAGSAATGAVDDFAVPQLARSRQPAVASRALLAGVPIMMISLPG